MANVGTLCDAILNCHYSVISKGHCSAHVQRHSLINFHCSESQLCLSSKLTNYIRLQKRLAAGECVNGNHTHTQIMSYVLISAFKDGQDCILCIAPCGIRATVKKTGPTSVLFQLDCQQGEGGRGNFARDVLNPQDKLSLRTLTDMSLTHGCSLEALTSMLGKLITAAEL